MRRSYAELFERTKRVAVSADFSDFDRVTNCFAIKVFEESLLLDACCTAGTAPERARRVPDHGPHAELCDDAPDRNGCVDDYYVDRASEDAAPKLVSLLAAKDGGDKVRLN